MDSNIKRELILDNFNYPNNKGLTNDPSYIKKSDKNPSCIDHFDIEIKLENNIVKDIRFDGEACAIATSSLSIAIHRFIGKSKEEVMEAVAEEYAKKILYSVEVTINSRDTVLEKLDEVAKSFIMMSQDQEEIFIEIQNADDGIIHEKVFKYLIEKLIPKIVEIVKIGNESGECNCKNPELYTQILLYGVSEKLNKVSSEKKMEIFISNLSALKNFVIKIYGIREEQKR